MTHKVFAIDEVDYGYERLTGCLTGQRARALL
jgi:hypothetical protein